MKKIIISGSRVGVAEVTNVEDKLPVGNYDICYNQMSGDVYLERLNDPKLPDNEFIDTTIVERWLKSFDTFDSNLGILLSGLKGAGKTVLAKKLCAKSGLPVLHLNNSEIPLDALSKFLADEMFKNCIVFVDEFEKVVSQDDERIAPWLKLMDGGYNTKLMFILTSNGENVSDYLQNRLGRIKYRKHFSTLEDETVERVIAAFLKDQSFKEDLLQTIVKIPMLSIDILVNIINEINLFNQPASELVKGFNLVSGNLTGTMYERYEGEWKECCFITLDLSDIDEAYIRKGWMDPERLRINEIYKKHMDLTGSRDKTKCLTDEEIIFSNRECYEYITNPEITKTKEGYILRTDKSVFRFVPTIKSNLLF